MSKALPRIAAISLCFLLSGCAVINHATCRLRAGEVPRPACHEGPTPHWRSYDGEWFPFMFEPAQGRTRGVVILIPGWDSVACDYSSLTEVLTAHGYAVYGMELRGGRYDPDVRRRGNPHDWHPWVEDAKSFVRFVAAQMPRDTPVFLHGQSFGTIIGIAAVIDLQREMRLRGVILQSPAIAMMAPKVTPLRLELLKIFAGLRFPQITGIEVMGMHLTADHSFECPWLHSSDRLREGYKVRFLKVAIELGARARSCAKDIRVPLLVMKGGNDKLAPPKLMEPDAYERFLQHELPPQATVRRYPLGDHLLIRGAGQKAALGDIVRWIEARTPVRH